MMRPLPAHAGDLAEVLAEAGRLLARGVADRRSPFHTPTLATIAADGTPSLRTLVLRGFDAAARHIRLHTDQRAGKWAELRADPRAALHVYDPGEQVQLRLAGRATLHRADSLATTAWEGSRPASRACYAIEPGPGTPAPSPPAAPAQDDSGWPHFGVIGFAYHRLEWLWLYNAGHRRARFDWPEEGAPNATWLVP